MNIKKNIIAIVAAGKPAFPDEFSLRKMLGYAVRSLCFECLFGCSLLYQTLVRLRVALYRHRIVTPGQLSCPVISVGNITTGGTGKTPAVIEIARLLAQRGTRVAVLSRGYRRDSSSPTVVVEPDSDVAQTGDEPLLMTRKFQREFRPPVPCPVVIVGSRRYQSGLLALERFRAEVMLMDDGFQHLQVARDCDVVLIDATQPFGGGYLLPAGFLREPLTHLRRASAFIITRSDEVPDLHALRRTLRRVNPAAPVFTAIHAFGGFRRLGQGAPAATEQLARQRLLAVSGIGNPASFHHLLETQGLQACETLVFPDHHMYTEADGRTIVGMCREFGLDGIVTSEKDETKLFPQIESAEMACYAAIVKLTIRPERDFQEFLFSYL